MTVLEDTYENPHWALELVDEGGVDPNPPLRPLREKLVFVDQDTAIQLEERGIVCASAYEDAQIRAALDKVDALLSKAPDLRRRINFCVKEVVILQAPGAEYDVSHSEPQWPNRIYISVPGQSLIQDLRVAEAIVHEAMHLNLTLFERIADVFQAPNKLLYSPWRDQDRPASGVLHGVYVFSCVELFFRTHVLPLEVLNTRLDFLSERIAQIRQDISRVNIDSLKLCLGRDGLMLLKHMVE